MELPVPVQPEDSVEVFVTPSPPSDAALSSTLAPREPRANLHLQVVVHFTEGTTRVPHPEVVDPASHRGVESRDQRPGGQCTAPGNEITRSEEHTSELQSLRHL